MAHGSCLITHSTTNVPAGAITRDPILDAAGRPRNGSDAWDYCDGQVTTDMYGYAAYDIPGVGNASGINDLGAYEQGDIIFTHGLGPYPRN
jgi:hypothetical protein